MVFIEINFSTKRQCKSTKRSTYYFLFQNDGVKIIRTVKISRRPTSIRNDMTHFAMSEMPEKEAEGPVEPSPGPMLLKEVIVLKMLSSKGQPASTSTTTLTKHITK